MHRMIESSSSSAGVGSAEVCLAAFEPLPLPRALAVGVSAGSKLFLCWPLVARLDLRTLSA